MSFRTATLKGARIGIYARYSTDRQSSRSVDDQIRLCREFVERAGGDPDAVQVFEDRAESGTSLRRSGGIERLIDATIDGRINCIVVEHTDRITRDVADGMTLWKRWDFHGVRLVGVSDGLDSADASGKLLFMMSLMRGEMGVDDTREKTRRGLKGRAHAGFATGLLPFGYRSEAGPASGGRPIAIDLARAAVVRRIFDECAAGVTLAEIAARLNADGIVPPRGNGTRKRDGWTVSGVRAILRNEKYIGRWRFNEREYIKVPGTKRRVSRARPASDVITLDRPDLRIVTDEVWARVAERFEQNRRTYRVDERKQRTSFGRSGKPSSYLLSGLLVCACGAPMTICGGSADRRYYYCDDNRKRGTCSNALSVRESIARESIVRGLRETLCSTSAIAYARKRIAARLGEIARSGNAHERQLRERLATAEARLDRLAEAVANGTGTTDVLLAKLREEEQKAKGLRAELAGVEAVARAPVSLPTPTDVLAAVTELDRLLCDDVAAGREALRRLLRHGTIRVTPGADGIYTAEAEVLPFGLLLAAPETATPAAAEPGGRYTTVDCGGRI